jgi:hypothetical protein
MVKWKKFEELSVLFLKQKIGSNYIVKGFGGSNSNENDIKVFTKEKKELFSIEAKLSPSQSGQFVIQKTDIGYIESSKNTYKNSFNSEILGLVNTTSFDEDVVTKLNCSKELNL